MAYYAEIRGQLDGNQVEAPTISNKLDSIRAYQWEVTFASPLADQAVGGTQPKPLTLAAKQVNGLGYSVEDIEVNRVNDKVYYPGKPSADELVITFDNIREERISRALYEFFRDNTYDPLNGDFSDFSEPQFKAPIHLTQLDASMQPINDIVAIGAYPKKYTLAEYNYSTNDFHTIEVTFRYDFLKHLASSTAGSPS
jgi:hypothetical protein